MEIESKFYTLEGRRGYCSKYVPFVVATNLSYEDMRHQVTSHVLVRCEGDPEPNIVSIDMEDFNRVANKVPQDGSHLYGGTWRFEHGLFIAVWTEYPL